MAIIFRDIIPANLLGQHKLAEEWFAQEDKTMYVNGCKATTHPNPYKIAEQLKDENAMNSAGLRSSNVKKVKCLSVTKPGTNTKITYKNAEGNTITRTYTSAINRKAYNLSEMEEKPFGELIAFMDELYKNVTTYWIQNFGCPENRINNEIEAAMMKMQVACCSIKQHKHQLGIHSDPSSRLPHCIFGKTVNDWDDNASKWVRSCDGGKLVLVDGCVPLDYGPSDVVFLNGNYLHVITNLKPKKGHKQVKGETLSRFSMQLYSDYQRNENKYGGYSKIGWPGVIVIEGEERDCIAYVDQIRSMRWQHLVVRGEEQLAVRDQEELEQARVLPNKMHELGDDMSCIAERCKNAGLEELFLTSMKIYSKKESVCSEASNTIVNTISSSYSYGALCHVDHMRDGKGYRKWLRKASAAAGCTLLVKICDANSKRPLIVVSILGEESDVKRVLKRWRTSRVDVDSAGKPCLERMMTVLIEGMLSQPQTKILDMDSLNQEDTLVVSDQTLFNTLHAIGGPEWSNEFNSLLHTR